MKDTYKITKEANKKLLAVRSNRNRFGIGVDKNDVITKVIRLKQYHGCGDLAGASTSELTKAYLTILSEKLKFLGVLHYYGHSRDKNEKKIPASTWLRFRFKNKSSIRQYREIFLVVK